MESLDDCSIRVFQQSSDKSHLLSIAWYHKGLYITEGPAYFKCVACRIIDQVFEINVHITLLAKFSVYSVYKQIAMC